MNDVNDDGDVDDVDVVDDVGDDDNDDDFDNVGQEFNVVSLKKLNFFQCLEIFVFLFIHQRFRIVQARRERSVK